MNRVSRKVGEVDTLRVNDKIIILDGKNPMMYVDLRKRRLYKYRWYKRYIQILVNNIKSQLKELDK